MLVDEKAGLMVKHPEPWPPGAPEVKNAGQIQAWGASDAKSRFLARYHQLM